MTTHLALLLVLQNAPLGPPQEVVLDSVAVEMEQGRFWHAARLLWTTFPEGPQGREGLTLLFAEAEAGWSNWPEVRALLQESLGEGEIVDRRAWHLLGKALESEGLWAEAEEAYSSAMEGSEAADGWEGVETLARRARARTRLGRFREALEDLEALGTEDSALGDWAALDAAGWAGESGAREETRMALGLVSSREVRELGWGFLPGALLASGDSAGAEAAYWSALPSLPSASAKALAWDRVGVLRMARRDTSGARGAFNQVLGLSSGGAEAVRAAQALLALGFESADAALTGARALAGGGRAREALEAYEVHEGFLDETPSPAVQLGKARAHLALGEVSRALALATELGESEIPAVGVPALTLRAQAFRQLGRGGEARGVDDLLVERFPERPEAVEILFLRADAMQGRGNLEGAILAYGETAALAPSQNRAGQARMRMGQLLQTLGRGEEALEVYSAYMADFPDGRRWDQAAFWAGRILWATDGRSEAEDILGRLQDRFPLSYYSVRAAELLAAAFDPEIPALPDTLPFPSFVMEGLERVDRLGAAGFGRGASWEMDALADRIRGIEDVRERQEGLLRLAKELNRRGFTREGINLGYELRRDDRTWDRDLLSTIYPFPYGELVMAAAKERDLDPFLMAGLIRQESAFWAEARSRADARGLMQVLPSTGRELARAVGPKGFRPDDHLFKPEINIHLGTKFFFDMRERFGGDLPIILSAYNAGPTRARRWREFPEAEDMSRFVERIPFTETRGYVKNVILNQAVYTWLYGGGQGDSPPVHGGQGKGN